MSTVHLGILGMIHDFLCTETTTSEIRKAETFLAQPLYLYIKKIVSISEVILLYSCNLVHTCRDLCTFSAFL